MTPIQNEIYKALEAMGDKSKFTDTVLAKKLRETAKIDGKKKAVIALADLTEALNQLASEGKIFALTITSANDILLERSETPKEIPLENKQRRQRHEKSQLLFTNADLKSQKNDRPSKNKDKKRTDRKTLNIYKNYGDED